MKAIRSACVATAHSLLTHKLELKLRQSTISLLQPRSQQQSRMHLTR